MAQAERHRCALALELSAQRVSGTAITDILLRALLYQGEISRAKAPDIIGLSERHAV